MTDLSPEEPSRDYGPSSSKCSGCGKRYDAEEAYLHTNCGTISPEEQRRITQISEKWYTAWKLDDTQASGKTFDTFIAGALTEQSLSHAREKEDWSKPLCTCKREMTEEQPGIWICWECDADAGGKIAALESERDELKRRVEELESESTILREGAIRRFDIDAQCLLSLESAGMGAEGKPNTLVAMVLEIVAAHSSLEAALMAHETGDQHELTKLTP